MYGVEEEDALVGRARVASNVDVWVERKGEERGVWLGETGAYREVRYGGIGWTRRGVRQETVVH